MSEEKGILGGVKGSAPYGWVRDIKNRLVRSRYGSDNLLETEVLLSTDELGYSNADNNPYEASQWRFLKKSLRPYRIGPDDSFLDIGAGMGRVVWQAARHYKFGRALGVELSPDLVEVAQANIDNTRNELRAAEVSVVVADATAYDIPDDINFIYMYNPFSGETFERVLANIVASVDRAPRRLVLIYSNPQMQAAVAASGRFEMVRQIKPRRPDIDATQVHHWINIYEMAPAGS